MYRNVMLIDDDSVDSMIHQRLLKKISFAANYICMNSAMDALEYLADESRPAPELIFLDIRMPRMDGFDFMEEYSKELQYKHPLCRIVVLSSTLHIGDHSRARQYPFVREVLVKPMNVEAVKLLMKEES